MMHFSPLVLCMLLECVRPLPYHLNHENEKHFRLKEAEVYVLAGQPLLFPCQATGGSSYSWDQVQFWFSDPQHGLRINDSYVHPAPNDGRTAVLRYTDTLQPRGMLVYCGIQRQSASGALLGLDTLERRSFKIVDSVAQMEPDFECNYVGLHMVDCSFRNYPERFGVLAYNMSVYYFDGVQHVRELPQQDCGTLPEGGFQERFCADCVYCLFSVNAFLPINVTLTLSNSVSARDFVIHNLEMGLHNSRLLAASDVSVHQQQQRTLLMFRTLAHLFYAEVLLTCIKPLVDTPNVHVLNASQSFRDPQQGSDSLYTVRLTGLMPDSQYRAEVRLRNLDHLDYSPIGLWSAPARHMFSTPPIAPLSPQLDAGSFWLQDCPAASPPVNGTAQPGCRVVTLYWKPLPRLLRGSGSPLTYIIRSDRSSAKIDVQSVHNRYKLQMSKLETRYSIAARTVHGVSSASELMVPASSHIPPPPKRVTITGDKNVTVMWLPPMTSTKVLGYTVHWCTSAPGAEVGNCSWGSEGDNHQESAYGLRSRNVSGSALQAVIQLPRHAEFYKFAVSVLTAAGSSGLTWAEDPVPHREAVRFTQYVVMAGVCVVLLLVAAIAAAYRYSEHLKRTVCVSIWRLPRPQVPRPPTDSGSKHCGGTGQVHSPNRYVGGRQCKEKGGLASDMAPLCQRSLSTKVSVSQEELQEAAWCTERFTCAVMSNQRLAEQNKEEARLLLDKGGNDVELVSPADSGVDGVSLTLSHGSHDSLQKQGSEAQRMCMDAAPNGYVTVGMQHSPSMKPDCVRPLGVHTSGYCRLGQLEQSELEHDRLEEEGQESPVTDPFSWDDASLHSLEYNRLADEPSLSASPASLVTTDDSPLSAAYRTLPDNSTLAPCSASSPQNLAAADAAQQCSPARSQGSADSFGTSPSAGGYVTEQQAGPLC